MSEKPVSESDKGNSTIDNWSGTTKRAAIVAAIDVAIIIIGLELQNYDKINLGWTVAAIGIITFFGTLSVSSYHKKHSAEGDKGTMRDALAASLICTYFVVLSFSIFEKINSGNTSVDSVLNSFSSVIMIMVGFYFGSKGAIEIYKIRGKG